MDGHKDPFASRESEKYENPIPSREFIMQLLEKWGQPASYERLVDALNLDDPDKIEALRRRLKAMVRDGQLLPDRRGAYGLVSSMNLIAGRVTAHKDGFGFLIPDKGGDDLFLSAKQMHQLFHGDRVLAAVVGTDSRGRQEGRLVEILERNTKEVVGQFFKEDGMCFVQPAGKQFTQDILIPNDKTAGAKSGQIVQAHIVHQPSKYRQATGEVHEILGEHMAPGMEIDVAIRSHQLPYRWPEDVTEAIREYSQDVPESAVKGRKDLRDMPLLTIDGDDSKDFDDAVFCSPREKGGWRLVVAIADVSSYVKPNTPLDQEAANRGNSVYFPGRVIPMLPEILSNGLCSLNPRVDRLCMVCDMTISELGQITHSSFYTGIMNSRARMTYNNVEKIVKGDKKLRKQFSEVAPHLDNLYLLYQALFNARQERGSLDFDTQETRIVFGRDKKIERIMATERNDAHRLIEECMLAANVSAANFLLSHKVPALYRVHEGPTEEKLMELRKFLSEFSLQLQGGTEPQPSDYAKLLKLIHQREDRYLIQTVLLRSLKQAVYTPDNLGHFGLGYDAYAQFTSPIRRYPDLIIHRAIKSIIEKNSSYPYEVEAMQKIGEHCSYTDRRADEATRDVTDWLKCEYMLDKVGQEFDGMVSSVTGFGLFIVLKEIFVEGLLHVTNLDSDYYQFDATHHVLRGQRSGKSFRLGDEVKIQVARVDLEKREIDFELVKSASKKGKK